MKERLSSSHDKTETKEFDDQMSTVAMFKENIKKEEKGFEKLIKSRF